MNKNKGQAISELHFGQIKTRIVLEPEFQAEHQALNAMVQAAHVPSANWAIENTFDPGVKGGKDETIKREIRDGQRLIGTIEQTVPTTSNYPQYMFEAVLERSLTKVLDAFRAYQGFSSSQQQTSRSQPGQSPLAQILPEAIQEVSQIQPKQLLRR